MLSRERPSRPGRRSRLPGFVITIALRAGLSSEPAVGLRRALRLNRAALIIPAGPRPEWGAA